MGNKSCVRELDPIQDFPSGEADSHLLLEQVSELVKRLSATGDGQATTIDHRRLSQPEVLLDFEVGDLRCVVTRKPRVIPCDSVVLSPREQEIARMVMKGYPNKTIAAVLEISIWTVGTHLRRIFAKLGVGTRASMVAQLLESEGDPPFLEPNALPRTELARELPRTAVREARRSAPTQARRID